MQCAHTTQQGLTALSFLCYWSKLVAPLLLSGDREMKLIRRLRRVGKSTSNSGGSSSSSSNGSNSSSSNGGGDSNRIVC